MYILKLALHVCRNILLKKVTFVDPVLTFSISLHVEPFKTTLLAIQTIFGVPRYIFILFLHVLSENTLQSHRFPDYLQVAQEQF